MIAKQRQSLLDQDPTVTGFNVGINAGASAGQTVFHIHLHLIPRRDGIAPTAPPPVALRVALCCVSSEIGQDIYVEAEKINILAGFAMNESQSFTAQNPQNHDRLRHAELAHSPTGLMRKCVRLKRNAREVAALNELGHRAMFDYELSMPRYSETPDLLWPLLKSLRPTPEQATEDKALDDPITLALTLQDLKERAKHEALWLVHLLRQTLLAIGAQSGLGDLIFYLEVAEITELSHETAPSLNAIAKRRRTHAKALKDSQPKAVELSLFDCEILSAPILQHRAGEDGEMCGNCVSGSTSTTGRVFVVDEAQTIAADAFAGFRDEDIIVCNMMNPEWLPQIQRASAVLSEVGGWLSHMSIVAREHNLLMLVACKRLHQLQAGEQITVHVQGTIEIADKKQTALKKTG